MTDWKLILTMFGEKATTDITKETDSQGFLMNVKLQPKKEEMWLMKQEKALKNV